MNMLKNLWRRWRLAWAIARLRRAGATGDPAAVEKAVAEVRALVTALAKQDHRLRFAAGEVQVACDKLAKGDS
jgi:hypothetical protein